MLKKKGFIGVAFHKKFFLATKMMLLFQFMLVQKKVKKIWSI